MTNYSSDSLKQALENQLRRLESKTDVIGKLNKRVSNFRLLAFIIGVGLIYVAARYGVPWIFGVVIGLAVISFIELVLWHRRIDKTYNELSAFATIRKNHLARMNLNWDKIPSSLSAKVKPDHPFAQDFNITGKQSLLKLINTTNYEGSTACLKRWFLQENFNLSDLSKRQQLVKEIKPMVYFRDRLQLYTKLAAKKASKEEGTMDDLLESLRNTKLKKFTLPLFILGTLSAINIALLILLILGIIYPYVIISFAIYLGVYNHYSPKTAGLFEEANQINDLLSQFRESLLYLESYPSKRTAG